MTPDDHPQRAEAVDALRAAWARIVGAPLSDAAERAIAARWTVRHVERLQTLAEFAWAHRTGLAEPLGGGPRSDHDRWSMAVNRAAEFGMCLSRAALPVEEVFAWLAVLAGSPDPGGYLAMRALADYDTSTGQMTPDWTGPSALRAYRTAAGLLAPLAWAAGLSISETRAVAVAGRLTEQHLLPLVALRGYRLP